jgi:hypothetical protein
MNNITNENQTLTMYSHKSDREILIENVKNWVILDQQLHHIHEKARQLRELKTNITTNICNYVKSNNTTTTIGISNGELRIYDKKEYKPLTFTYVEKCLHEMIKDKNQVEYIIKYLKDNRELNISQDIKRISAKI